MVPPDRPGAQQGALLVHVIHSLRMGGMENTLVNLINHLPHERFRHAVLCIEDSSDFRDRITRPGVEVVELRRSQVGVRAMRREITRLLRQWRPALVHTRNLSGLDALWPAWRAGVPMRVHSEHGWDVDNLDGRQWKPLWLRRLHVPLVHAYLTVSQDLARFLQHRVGVAPGRIHQVYNGVDTTRFQPRATQAGDDGGASDAGARLVRCGLAPAGWAPPDALVVGTVGRLQAVKDQRCLLAAAAAVLQRAPQWRRRLRVLVVGSGPLQAELQAQIEALALTDVCRLTGPSDAVADVMRALDLFVLPSLNEGISNTVLEAMASGLPVLATGVGGNPELVAPGLTGELFRPGDVQALAGLMLDLLGDPDRLQRQAAAARQRAQAQFSLQGMRDRYASLYGEWAGIS